MTSTSTPTLRSITLDDAQELTALVEANRNHLRPWLVWVDRFTTPEHAIWWITRVQEDEQEGCGYVFAICLGDQIVGTAALKDVDRTNRCAEVGYWIGKKFEGKGIMTQAVEALCDKAFHELGLHRLYLYLLPRNERSIALAERLAFQREGLCRDALWLHDEPHDAFMYGRLATD
jgi:ribosomal-protein-serine acetyltransferase